VIKSPSMPLRSRLAAVHGDADQAAKLLGEAARGVALDIERLRVTPPFTANAEPAHRRGLWFSFGRSAGQRLPGVVGVPAPTA